MDNLDKSGRVVEAPATPSKPSSQSAKHDTGKIVSTVSVKSLGTEVVANRKARHYLITTDMQEYGCAGKDHIRAKQEIWVADVAMPVFDCDLRHNVAAMSYMYFKDDCDCAFVQKGDVAAFMAAYKGVIVKMKMFEGSSTKVVMSQETTMISSAKLTDADFAVPAGYKKVTNKEYEQARQKAMMNAMSNGAMSGDENDDSQTDNTRQNASQDNRDQENASDSDSSSENGDKPDNGDSSDDDAVKGAILGKMKSRLPRF